MLIHLENEIQDAFINNEHLIAVAVDIEKAYDMTWIHRVLKILAHEAHIQGRMLRFLNNMHKDRSSQVRVQNTLSEPFSQENGISQGLATSCTLFLVAINSLAHRVDPYVKALLFADDCTMYIRSSDISIIQERLQTSLNNLSDWSKETGFKISFTKTNAIHFCKKRKHHENPNLSYNNIEIKYVDELKLLGLTFDRKLTWRSHISKLKTTCLKDMNIIKALSSISYGSNTNTLLQLYKSLIRSKLDYASIVYSSASPKTLQSLDSVHHQGIRLSLGAFKSTRITSILAESGEPCLDKRRHLLAINYVINLRRNPNHINNRIINNQDFARKYETKPRSRKPFRIRFLSILTKYNIHLEEHNIIKHVRYTVPYWVYPKIKVDLSLKPTNKKDTPPAKLKSDFLQHVQEKYNETLFIYTDGSKSERGVASAFYSEIAQFQQTLNKCNSIFTAEMMAIYFATSFIRRIDLNNITICSDSLSSILAIEHGQNKHPLCASIIENIILSRKNIIFLWIPSHVGIYGNERADQLATQSFTSNSPVDSSIDSSDLKKELRKTIIHTWKMEWLSELNNKLRTIKTNVEATVLPAKLTRHQQVAITRLRLGHTNLTHSYLMNKTTPPTCDTCNQPLTVLHILDECRKFNNIKNKLQLPPTISQLLVDQQEKIISFLKEADLIDLI